MGQTADIWRWSVPDADLSSATDCKPEQRAADDQHDDHDQNEFTDTGDKTSSLKLGGEQADLGRSEGHDYQG